eukprot:TRINITY_DN2204_c0_g1_i2.p1 TRINITY_DN2204_c0_g1~~TRINITY_DN2204_c0_g1_i2.p1  ORF type:complete len:1492 (-),score=576.19 TRINITY_DN2204_c0_g1_i2:276-4751(-)
MEDEEVIQIEFDNLDAVFEDEEDETPSELPERRSLQRVNSSLLQSGAPTTQSPNGLLKRASKSFYFRSSKGKAKNKSRAGGRNEGGMRLSDSDTRFHIKLNHFLKTLKTEIMYMDFRSVGNVDRMAKQMKNKNLNIEFKKAFLQLKTVVIDNAGEQDCGDRWEIEDQDEFIKSLPSHKFMSLLDNFRKLLMSYENLPFEERNNAAVKEFTQEILCNQTTLMEMAKHVRRSYALGIGDGEDIQLEEAALKRSYSFVVKNTANEDEANDLRAQLDVSLKKQQNYSSLLASRSIEITDLQDKLKRAEDSVKGLEVQSEGHKDLAEALTKDLRVQKQRNQELYKKNSENDDLKRNIESLLYEKSQLAKSHEKIKDEIDTNKREMIKIRSAERKSSDTILALKAQKESLKTKITTLQDELLLSEEKHQNQLQATQEARKQLRSQADKIANVECGQLSAQNEVDVLKAELSELRIGKSSYQSTQREMNDKLHNLDAENVKLKSEIESHKDIIKQLQLQITGLETKSSKLDEKSSNLVETERAKFKLESTVEHLKNEISGLKNELLSKNDQVTLLQEQLLDTEKSSSQQEVTMSSNLTQERLQWRKNEQQLNNTINNLKQELNDKQRDANDNLEKQRLVWRTKESELKEKLTQLQRDINEQMMTHTDQLSDLQDNWTKKESELIETISKLRQDINKQAEKHSDKLEDKQSEWSERENGLRKTIHELKTEQGRLKGVIADNTRNNQLEISDMKTSHNNELIETREAASLTKLKLESEMRTIAAENERIQSELDALKIDHASLGASSNGEIGNLSSQMQSLVNQKERQFKEFNKQITDLIQEKSDLTNQLHNLQKQSQENERNLRLEGETLSDKLSNLQTDNAALVAFLAEEFDAMKLHVKTIDSNIKNTLGRTSISGNVSPLPTKERELQPEEEDLESAIKDDKDGALETQDIPQRLHSLKATIFSALVNHEHSVEMLASEVDTLNSDLESKNDEHSKALEKQKTLLNTNHDSQRDINKLELAVQDWQRKYEKSLEDVSVYQKKTVAAQNDVALLKDHLLEEQSSLEQSKSKQNILEKTIDSLRASFAVNEDSLKVSQSDLKKASDRVSEQEDKIDELNAEKRTLTQQITSLNEQVEHLHQTEENLRAQVQHLISVERQQASSRITLLEKVKTSMKTKCESQDTEIGSLKIKISELEEKLSERSRTLETASDDLEHRNAELIELRELMSKSQSEVDFLTEKVRLQTQHTEQLETQLKSQKRELERHTSSLEQEMEAIKQAKDEAQQQLSSMEEHFSSEMLNESAIKDLLSHVKNFMKVLKSEVVFMNHGSIQQRIMAFNKLFNSSREGSQLQRFKLAHLAVKQIIVEVCGEQPAGTKWDIPDLEKFLEKIPKHKFTGLFKELEALVVSYDNMTKAERRQLVTAQEVIMNAGTLVNVAKFIETHLPKDECGIPRFRSSSIGSPRSPRTPNMNKRNSMGQKRRSGRWDMVSSPLNDMSGPN